MYLYIDNSCITLHKCFIVCVEYSVKCTFFSCARTSARQRSNLFFTGKH